MSIAAGVPADQKRANMITKVGRRQLAAVQGRVTDPDQAVLGLDDQGDVVTADTTTRASTIFIQASRLDHQTPRHALDDREHLGSAVRRLAVRPKSTSVPTE